MHEEHERHPDPPPEPRDDEQPAEHGAEAYGGDPDSEPSVTPEEADRGLERDQAEG